jgi:O-antigen/teichoic acid export membrane protein
LSAAADPFTRAVFGERWLRMIGPLTVIGIWAALRPIDATLGSLLNAANRAGVVGWVSAAILVPLVPGFLLASQVGMLTAIAIVVLLDTLMSMSLLSTFVRRYVGVGFSQQWRAVAPIAVAAGPTWLASFAIGHAIGTGQPGLGLVLAVLGGLAAYGLTLSLISPKLLPHAFTQVLRVFGRGPGGEPPVSGPSPPRGPAADPFDAPVPGTQ